MSPTGEARPVVFLSAVYNRVVLAVHNGTNVTKIPKNLPVRRLAAAASAGRATLASNAPRGS
jgi:hypothetical protein